MKRFLLVAVLFGLAAVALSPTSAAQNTCGCYCMKMLPPPCSDDACKQACGWTSGRSARSVDCGGGRSCPAGETCGSGSGCIRAGYVQCGNGQCPPGQKCIAAGKCIPNTGIDCGDGHDWCPAGKKCTADGKCVTNTDIDCGDGHWCRAGYTCTSGGMCVPPGRVECGGYTCPAGDTCLGDNKCLPAGRIDCGNGHTCPVGESCKTGGGCESQAASQQRQQVAAERKKLDEEKAKQQQADFEKKKAQLLSDMNNASSSQAAGKPLAWEQGRPERKAWSDELRRAIGPNLVVLETATDITQFAPNYASLSKSQRLDVWAALFEAIVSFEDATFDPTKSVLEDKILNKKTKKYYTPYPSIGLFQLSYKEQSAYGWKEDMKSKYLEDPLANIRCGVKVLTYWVKHDHVIASGGDKDPRGGAQYWKVLREGHHIKDIQKMVKEQALAEGLPSGKQPK